MSEQEKKERKAFDEFQKQYEKLDQNGKSIVNITLDALAARQNLESNDEEKKS